MRRFREVDTYKLSLAVNKAKPKMPAFVLPPTSHVDRVQPVSGKGGGDCGCKGCGPPATSAQARVFSARGLRAAPWSKGPSPRDAEFRYPTDGARPSRVRLVNDRLCPPTEAQRACVMNAFHTLNHNRPWQGGVGTLRERELHHAWRAAFADHLLTWCPDAWVETGEELGLLVLAIADSTAETGTDWQLTNGIGGTIPTDHYGAFEPTFAARCPPGPEVLLTPRQARGLLRAGPASGLPFVDVRGGICTDRSITATEAAVACRVGREALRRMSVRQLDDPLLSPVLSGIEVLIALRNANWLANYLPLFEQVAVEMGLDACVTRRLTNTHFDLDLADRTARPARRIRS